MDINMSKCYQVIFPSVDVSYCSDDFILYPGDYITCQYVKAANNYQGSKCLRKVRFPVFRIRELDKKS